MRNDLETVVSTRVEEKFHRGWRRGGEGGGGRKEEKEERPFKYSMKTVYVFLFFSFPSRDRSSLVKRPTTRYEDPVPFVRIIVRIDVYSALDRLFVASFLLPPSFEKFAAIQVELCALVARRKEGGRERKKKKRTSGKHRSEIWSALSTENGGTYQSISKFSTKFQICFLAPRLDCLPLPVSILFLSPHYPPNFLSIRANKTNEGREVDNNRFVCRSR